jgi:ABC-type proline/glycine betaine transport system ATPase subunit
VAARNDEVTRQEVCAQLRSIQRKLKLTTIHVSHNLEEAFSVADRAAILHNGVLKQIGTMDELVLRPNSGFVARFMRCDKHRVAGVPPAGTEGILPS